MLRGDILPAQSSKSDFIFQLVSIQQDIVIDPEEEDADEDDEEEKEIPQKSAILPFECSG